LIDESRGFHLSLAKLTAISLKRAPFEDGCHRPQLTDWQALSDVIIAELYSLVNADG